MLAALDSSETGTDLRLSFDKHGRTANNGSAMRSACYGVLAALDQIRIVSQDCAMLTHQGLGVEGAFAVAAASHYFLNGGKKAGFNDFLAENVNPTYTTRMHNRVAKQNGPLTFLTVCAAFTAIRDSHTLTQVVERSIRVGGDVDTVAAIAMGVAGSCAEIENDLPAWVVEGIRPVAGLTWDDLVLMDRDLTQVFDARP
jgi:ADP-ribosylglycohydrolase